MLVRGLLPTDNLAEDGIMPYVLTTEAAAEYENWVRRDDCCSCHLSPPCNYCIDPGNLFNLLETDDSDEGTWVYVDEETFKSDDSFITRDDLQRKVL